MSFPEAAHACPHLRGKCKPGLQALPPRDRQRIDCPRPRCLTASLNLDEALEQSLPNDPRWDYGIGFRTHEAHCVCWIEVHPATQSEAVIKKIDWLKHWLKQNAAALDALPATFVWLASGAVRVTPASPALKRLAARGVMFRGRQARIPPG